MRQKLITILLVITTRCACVSVSTVSSWSQIKASAGPPTPRLFEANERLFGASEPEVIFWRDAAGWCPFCEMTWLMLEAMAVPYRIRTVPLRRYMLDGEQKDPEYLAMVGPDGVVPGLQFRDAGTYGSAIQSVERIFDELRRRYPTRFPSSSVSALVCDGEKSVFGRLRVARRSYEACAGAESFASLSALDMLASALSELDAMLATAEAKGGWLDGSDSPSVADLMLLPFLERTAAVVPYFFGLNALELAGVPFARAQAYVDRARASHAAYAALTSDATTLARTNLRYAAAGATPRYSVPSTVADETAAAVIDGTDERTREEWATAATAAARCEAAARLARHPSRVAAFARRCAGLEDEDDEAPVDDALRAVASLLLGDGTATVHERARTAADELRDTHDADALADAAEALAALSVNVGVPRDMEEDAARALRSHVRIVADALDAPKAADAIARLRGGHARPRAWRSQRPPIIRSSGPELFSVYYRNDNCTRQEHTTRVLMMVCDVSESEATAIIMAANRDRWKNRALCGTWEEVLAQHVYAGMQSAGVPAAIVPVDAEVLPEHDDVPRYLDGTPIEYEDLPHYYQ